MSYYDPYLTDYQLASKLAAAGPPQGAPMGGAPGGYGAPPPPPGQRPGGGYVCPSNLSATDSYVLTRDSPANHNTKHTLAQEDSRDLEDIP